MARELFERLVTVFDCTEADGRIALSFGWMQLTQGNHSLAVALFVESDRRPEPPRIISVIRSVINLDQGRWLDTTELASTRYPTPQLITLCFMRTNRGHCRVRPGIFLAEHAHGG